jgi:hypothetical protein
VKQPCVSLCTPRAITSLNGYGLFRVMTKERPEIPSRRQRRRHRLGFLRIQMETGDVNPRAALVRAASAAIGLANVVCGPRRPAAGTIGSGISSSACSRTTPASRAYSPAIHFPINPRNTFARFCFKYQFTTSEEHRTTGAWWKRREIGEFFPEASLNP